MILSSLDMYYAAKPLYVCLLLSVCLGEEKEKKIIQVPMRLYAFDVSTHTWKERGRGEVRLNDAAQSEGLFQSRLGEGSRRCNSGYLTILAAS